MLSIQNITVLFLLCQRIFENYFPKYFETENISEVAGYIVQDNIVVGVMIKDYRNEEIPCFPEECVCYDYASDNNGAGYKTRESYVYLVCVPENF